MRKLSYRSKLTLEEEIKRKKLNNQLEPTNEDKYLDTDSDPLKGLCENEDPFNTFDDSEFLQEFTYQESGDVTGDHY